MNLPPSDYAATAAPATAIAAPAGSWGALVAIGFGAFALITAEFMPVGLLPQIARDMNVTVGQAGLVLTTSGVVAAVAAPTTVGLAWSIDRRKLILSMLALLMISNLVVGVAPNFVVILIGRVLLGATLGAFWTIAGALGPRMRPGRNAGLATAVIISGVSLGTVAGIPAGAVFGSLLGWRMAFGASAALTIVVLAAVAVSVPSLPSRSGGGLKDLRFVLHNRHVRFAIAWTIVSFIGQFAGYTYISSFVLQVVHLNPVYLSAVLFAFGLAGVVGNVLGGLAVGSSAHWALIGTLVLLGASLILLVLVGANPTLSITLLVIWGLGFGMQPIVTQSWLFSAAPDHHEGAQALFVSSVQFSIASGAFIGGLFFDQFGIKSAFLLAAVTAGLSAAMFLRRRAA